MVISFNIQKVFNLTKLKKEILDITEQYLNGTHQGDILNLTFDNNISQAEQGMVSQIVADHDPFDLAYAQARAKECIQHVYVDKLDLGMTYNGQQFATDKDSQPEWISLTIEPESLPFPFNVPTLDSEGELTLNNATEVLDLYKAIRIYILGQKGIAAYFKKLVMLQTTQEGIDGVFKAYVES